MEDFAQLIEPKYDIPTKIYEWNSKNFYFKYNLSKKKKNHTENILFFMKCSKFYTYFNGFMSISQHNLKNN